MEIKSAEGQFQNGQIVLPEEKNLMIIVGGNNSGKTTILREITKGYQPTARLISVHRTTIAGEGPRQSHPNMPYNISDNDNSGPQVQILQDFFALDDIKRTPILEWYNQYFPNPIYEERENPANSASPLLLKVNGFAVTRQGTGIRATLEIFVKLFDDSISVLCIDEPEMGLEPTLQKYLFQAIKDKASEGKKIIIATHSHHFLDIEEMSNNFMCERDMEGKIYLTQVTDLKPVIFRLLGNTLSSFLLPEKILVLEGPSDTTYLQEVLKRKGKSIYSIHNSKGIGNVSYAVHAITQFFNFNAAHLSVYKDKISIIVDKPTKDILVREWSNKVDNPDTQICILGENGIEYYYPERILQYIFNTNEKRKAIVDGYLKNNGTYNGKAITKTELSILVTNLLESEDLAEEGNQLLTYIDSLPI